MCRSRTGLAVLLLALGCTTVARSDDTRKAPDDPDPGFLEFLGSVDRLAERDPDYLSHAGAIAPGGPAGKPAGKPADPPTPSPPQPLSPPSASVSGGHNE